jgi:hypothetical protein
MTAALLRAALTLTLYAQQGVPQPPRTGLVVQVRDGDRHAIGGASVVVVDAAGRIVAQEATTADGIARIPDVAVGAFEIRVTAAGFSGESQSVRIDRGSLASVDFTLAATAASPLPPRVESTQETPAPSGIPPRQLTPEEQPPAPTPRNVFVPMPDRWNLSFPDWDRYGERGDYPYVGRHWWDPYDQNRAKGDYPAIGQQTFFVFTGVVDSLLEGRDVPTAVGPSSERPLSESFFGRGDQYLPVVAVRTSFDLFHGDTAFRPADWRVRVQPAFSLNFLSTEETGVVNRDVREGLSRLDSHVGLQEAFVEKKLFDLSANYDFLSVRAGIQELSTDFKGFIAVVEQPGIRLFGTLRSSRIEYNAAVFDFLEKDTNSGFNTFERRGQQMAVANVYVQDFLTPGYTTEFSVHYNRDAGGLHFDTNGFIVRPAPIGVVKPHEIQAYYLGWAGNGHIGRLNISHAFYQALGTDDFNAIAARPVDINAQMAAVEASVDREWVRVKGGVFWASGDGNISDGTARGFDSIVDIPVFAGGPFSVWNREGIALPQTGTGLVSPFSLLPSLRTNKDEGQANFVNPGILILYGGGGVELTPKLRAFLNGSFLRFQDTESLEALLFQSPIHQNVGFDFGGGVEYRPPLSENIVVSGGAAAMRLGAGLRDIYGRDYFVSLFANLRVRF